jgi:integrase
MDETFTFLEYADDEAARMWNRAHKYRLHKMAENFDGFSDFGTRPITKYKPRQIHDFLDYLTDECDLSNNTVIAKIMGHRSLVTTSKYVKLMPEVQQSVCDAT